MNHDPFPWRKVVSMSEFKPRPPLLKPPQVKYRVTRRRPLASWIVVLAMVGILVAILLWPWLGGRR